MKKQQEIKKVTNKKVPDEVIIEAYNRIGNVWKVAEEVGLCGQSVHERVKRLGLKTNANPFTELEVERLKADYLKYLLDGNLQGLADEMGRTKQFICRQAGKLGLTDMSRDKKCIKGFKPSRQKGYFDDKEHPRGMAGKKHSDETKAIISVKSKMMHDEFKSNGRADEIKKKTMVTRFKNGNYVQKREKASWKSGWREVGGAKYYFRSRWEANYAHYLESCRVSGVIKKWEHEPHLFVFEAVETKYKTYLPDFRVTMADNLVEYHEVKGWFDERSKAKIEYMGLYFPEVCLKIFDGDWFNRKTKRLEKLVPNWEN